MTIAYAPHHAPFNAHQPNSTEYIENQKQRRIHATQPDAHTETQSQRERVLIDSNGVQFIVPKRHTQFARGGTFGAPAPSILYLLLYSKLHKLG